MLLQKFEKLTEYLSDPLNGQTNCCMCCLKFQPLTVIKLIGFQDFIISVGLILVGINAIVELDIFNLFLKTLSSDSLTYGIVFTASGGVMLISIIIYYIANRKKNSKCFGLFYVIIRGIIYVAMTVYSVLLLLCLIDNSSNEPIYGFETKTKQEISSLTYGKYIIFGCIIVYTLLNHFFSLILYLSHKFVSSEYDYEKKINMDLKAVKQDFAPEWFRNSGVNQQKQMELQQEVKNKNVNIAENNEPLKETKKLTYGGHKKVSYVETKPINTVTRTKKSKFSQNKIVPMFSSESNDEPYVDIRTKSTKLILPEEDDFKRPSQNTMKIINIDAFSSSSLNDN